MERLELSLPSKPDPKSGVSTNFTTRALPNGDYQVEITKWRLPHGDYQVEITGVEPMTLCVQGRCSIPTELNPQYDEHSYYTSNIFETFPL